MNQKTKQYNAIALMIFNPFSDAILRLNRTFIVLLVLMALLLSSCASFRGMGNAGCPSTNIPAARSSYRGR